MNFENNDLDDGWNFYLHYKDLGACYNDNIERLIEVNDIITFWKTYDDHENSHKSETFQPLFQKVIDVCENGNEEIVYSMLWSGEAYTPEMAERARTAKKDNQ